MTSDVAIIGVGLHPFGQVRQDAMQMGRRAIQFALTDAGCEVERHPVRLRRQPRGVQPRRGDPPVGLTGITFNQRVQRLCHRGQRHSADRRHHPVGKYDIGIAIGLTSIPRGAFTDDPAKLALPQWYANNWPVRHHKFLSA